MPKLEITAEPGSHAIYMKRTFNAPRDLVFRAYVDPEGISKWYGPRNMKTVVDKFEPRPGGIWRFLNIDPDGNEYAFRGVFHDVVSPERIVQTFEFEGAPGHVSMESLRLEEQDGVTQLHAVSVFQSVEARDAMVQSGMEEGAVETYDRLEEFIETLK